MGNYLIVWPKSEDVVHINYHYTQFGEVVDYLNKHVGGSISAIDCDVQDIEVYEYIKQHNISKVVLEVNYENARNANVNIDANGNIIQDPSVNANPNMNQNISVNQAPNPNEYANPGVNPNGYTAPDTNPNPNGFVDPTQNINTDITNNPNQ